MFNPKILCLPPVANILRDLDMRFTWVINLERRICIIIYVLAYFDACPSLNCHPCYHNKIPFSLIKLLLKLLSFYILKFPI